MLKVRDLKASVNGRQILKDVSLEIKPGELHVLMGPNGSGKSTLAQVIMGSPQFTVTSSQLKFAGKDLRKLTPDKRAKLGIFLGFQQPVEIPGVSVFNMLRRARQSLAGPVGSFPPRLRQGFGGQAASDSAAVPLEAKRSGAGSLSTAATRSDISSFRQELLEYAASLKLSEDFLRRSLNEGFSGGEKKRSEILQMMTLEPKLAILDEPDSGLDIDALKLVANAIKQFLKLNPHSSVLLITHYARILKYLKPDFVHVMVEGKIVKSGRSRLAAEIERSGYRKFQSRIQNLKIKSQKYLSTSSSLSGLRAEGLSSRPKGNSKFKSL